LIGGDCRIREAGSACIGQLEAKRSVEARAGAVRSCISLVQNGDLPVDQPFDVAIAVAVLDDVNPDVDGYAAGATRQVGIGPALAGSVAATVATTIVATAIAAATSPVRLLALGPDAGLAQIQQPFLDGQALDLGRYPRPAAQEVGVGVGVVPGALILGQGRQRQACRQRCKEPSRHILHNDLSSLASSPRAMPNYRAGPDNRQIMVGSE
jgi:hypothetical protein